MDGLDLRVGSRHLFREKPVCIVVQVHEPVVAVLSVRPAPSAQRAGPRGTGLIRPLPPAHNRVFFSGVLSKFYLNLVLSCLRGASE